MLKVDNKCLYNVVLSQSFFTPATLPGLLEMSIKPWWDYMVLTESHFGETEPRWWGRSILLQTSKTKGHFLFLCAYNIFHSVFGSRSVKWSNFAKPCPTCFSHPPYITILNILKYHLIFNTDCLAVHAKHISTYMIGQNISGIESHIVKSSKMGCLTLKFRNFRVYCRECGNEMHNMSCWSGATVDGLKSNIIQEIQKVEK